MACSSKWKSLLALALVVSLAGCSSTPDSTDDVGDAAAVGDASSSAAGSAGGGLTTMPARGEGAWRGSALDDPSSPLYNRVIYFDFDSYDVLPEYRELVRAHSGYIATHPAVQVTLEGHTDDRGSREYNIALGEKRAQAVRRLMSVNGVAGTQARIVSYGEERPASLGESDQARSQNRRVEIVY